MEKKHCLKCGIRLPDGYKHNLCDTCRTVRASKVKRVLTIIGIIGAVAGAVILKSRINDEGEDNDGNLYNEEGHKMKFSNKWFENATDDELDSEREKVRERYVDGTIDIDEADILYDTLHSFNVEMINRANIKYEKEHPDTQPRYREHGWYLQNDD